MLLKLRSLAAMACLASLVACGGSGSGTGTSDTGTLSLTASSTSLAFGATQTVGTASAYQTVTLSNKNSSAITLNSITLAGANPASFSFASNCTNTLAASSSCAIWVTFGPTAAAAATATISVASSAFNTPTTIALTGTGVASTSASNVAPLLVDAGPIGLLSTGYYQINKPFTTVTVCTPGSTTNCQVIDHVLVDTNSTGLRILAGALAPGGSTPTGGAVPAPITVGGNPLRECLLYPNGYTWGSMVTADVTIGGQTLASLPVNLIGDTAAGSAPSDCAASASNLSSVAALGVNGILGVSGLSSKYDCPSCAAAAQATSYYSCPSGGTCVATAVPLASQAVNPIAALPADNNGVVIALNAPVAGGSQSVSGSLVFGINTETNNGLGTAQLLATTAHGAFSTSFQSTVYTSYVSSTAIANYFYNASLTACSDYTAFYCPATTQTQSALLISDDSTTSASTSFAVDNADVDLGNSSAYSAFGGLSGVQSSSSSPFIWGLPFFYGRSVYLLYSGQTIGNVTGPAIGLVSAAP